MAATNAAGRLWLLARLFRQDPDPGGGVHEATAQLIQSDTPSAVCDAVVDALLALSTATPSKAGGDTAPAIHVAHTHAVCSALLCLSRASAQRPQLQCRVLPHVYTWYRTLQPFLNASQQQMSTASLTSTSAAEAQESDASLAVIGCALKCCGIMATGNSALLSQFTPLWTKAANHRHAEVSGGAEAALRITGLRSRLPSPQPHPGSGLSAEELLPQSGDDPCVWNDRLLLSGWTRARSGEECVDDDEPALFCPPPALLSSLQPVVVTKHTASVVAPDDDDEEEDGEVSAGGDEQDAEEEEAPIPAPPQLNLASSSSSSTCPEMRKVMRERVVLRERVNKAITEALASGVNQLWHPDGDAALRTEGRGAPGRGDRAHAAGAQLLLFALAMSVSRCGREERRGRRRRGGRLLRPTLFFCHCCCSQSRDATVGYCFVASSLWGGGGGGGGGGGSKRRKAQTLSALQQQHQQTVVTSACLIAWPQQADQSDGESSSGSRLAGLCATLAALAAEEEGDEGDEGDEGEDAMDEEEVGQAVAFKERRDSIPAWVFKSCTADSGVDTNHKAGQQQQQQQHVLLAWCSRIASCPTSLTAALSSLGHHLQGVMTVLLHSPRIMRSPAFAHELAGGYLAGECLLVLGGKGEVLGRSGRGKGSSGSGGGNCGARSLNSRGGAAAGEQQQQQQQQQQQHEEEEQEERDDGEEDRLSGAVLRRALQGDSEGDFEKFMAAHMSGGDCEEKNKKEKTLSVGGVTGGVSRSGRGRLEQLEQEQEEEEGLDPFIAKLLFADVDSNSNSNSGIPGGGGQQQLDEAVVRSGGKSKAQAKAHQQCVQKLLRIDTALERHVLGDDANGNRLEFPPCDSFERLLIHRLAERYLMDHVVTAVQQTAAAAAAGSPAATAAAGLGDEEEEGQLELSSSAPKRSQHGGAGATPAPEPLTEKQQCVVVYRKPYSRLPRRRIADLISSPGLANLKAAAVGAAGHTGGGGGGGGGASYESQQQRSGLNGQSRGNRKRGGAGGAHEAGRGGQGDSKRQRKGDGAGAGGAAALPPPRASVVPWSFSSGGGSAGAAASAAAAAVAPAKSCKNAGGKKQKTLFVPRRDCAMFLRGKCAAGASCTFRHDLDERLKAVAALPSKATVCKFFKAKSCLKGALCPFGHDLKVEACQYMVAKGFCYAGDKCEYGHGAALVEVRRAAVREEAAEAARKAEAEKSCGIMLDSEGQQLAPVSFQSSILNPQNDVPAEACAVLGGDATDVGKHDAASEDTAAMQGASKPMVHPSTNPLAGLLSRLPLPSSGPATNRQSSASEMLRNLLQ